MSVSAGLRFYAATLTHVSGDDITAALLEPSVARIGSSASELAGAFGDAVRKCFLETGAYHDVLRYAQALELRRMSVPLSIPASKDGHLFPAHEMAFDAFAAALPGGGVLGFIPALGIEAFVDKADDLPKRLQEYVRLEFARTKRLTSVRKLLAAGWYPRVEVKETVVPSQFYSLAELKELRLGRQHKFLPAVAEPLTTVRPRAFGLEEPLEQMIRAARGKYARSILLVGPSGVGKSALVEEFARVRAAHPDLAPKTVWETTAARMIQKLIGPSGWQEPLDRLCLELRDDGGWLYVRSLADLFEVGQYSGNEVSMAAALRPALERGEVLLITECTEEEVSRLDVRAPGYTSLFTTIRMAPPGDAALDSIVRKRVEIARPDAVSEALRLQRRYSPYSGFPGKTVRFLESLVPGRSVITRADVLRQFCEETGMPAFVVDPDVPLPLEELDRRFRTSVFGQDEAVDIVLDLLASVKAGLARTGKPIASLLFTGPTGVGKTELAKVLAETLFGHRSRMVRLDMSEFQDPYAVQRLVGQGRGDGLLTGAVRQAPFSVVLFDELEKADPSFFDLLLQVLGEGRLTDARGRVADFCSTIIIMTSNLGASDLPRGALGFRAEGDRTREIADHFRRAAEAHFRPELFNRIDRLVAFHPLSREVVRKIVDREMALVRKRSGLSIRPVELKIDPAAYDALGERGYDAAWGARQLQRTIRDALLVPLSRQLNRFEARSPVDAEVDGTLEPRVRGVDRKTGADAVFEGGLSLPYVCGEISNLRRLAHDVADGTLLVQLHSEIEILERRRAKMGDAAFAKSPHAVTLARQAKIVRDWNAVCAEAEELEIESVVGRLDPKEDPPFDLPVELKKLQARIHDLMLDIHDTLHPESRRTMLAVYGSGDPLEWLADLYVDAAKILGLSAEIRRLWHLPEADRYATTPGAKPPAKDALLIGFEFEFFGRAASLVFPQEEGHHRLNDRDGKKPVFVVRVSASTREEYEKSRSTSVHRKTFFDAKSFVRTYVRDNRGAVTFGSIALGEDPSKKFAEFLRAFVGPRLVGIMKA
jgi:ATP-dependent Clp protease ATP-binding subunit ClpA